jgi:hypothetical protein
MSWGRNPSLNIKFTYVSYIPYACVQRYLEVIHTLFLMYLHFDHYSSPEVRCGIFHLWCYAGTQNASNFEALQITDFQTR